MFFTIIFVKLRTLLYFIIYLIRRTFCCFRKRRHPYSETEPLTYVAVDINDVKNEELNKWADWEDKNSNPIEEHIKFYRQAILAPQQQEEPNFFEEMTPNITQQTKLLIKQDINHSIRQSGYSLEADTLNIVS